MKILRIEISGFRGINHAVVDFERNSVLIGPNNCGKSTIVEALALTLGRDRMVRNLTEVEVASWVANSFPIILVDELQDCKKERLDIFDGLSHYCKIFAAADWFQDLTGGDKCLAVEWLKEKGTGEELVVQYRTNQEHLISTSNEIRLGVLPTNTSKKGIYIGYGRRLGLSITLAAQNLSWYGSKDAAILCPTGPDKCNLFKILIEELSTKRHESTVRGRKQSYGPFKISFEQSTDQMEKELLKGLGLQGAKPGAIIDNGKLLIGSDCSGIREFREWLKNEEKFKGRCRFPIEEIKDQIPRAVQRVRAYSFASCGGIRAMTIHQAKNREFSNVILLWPYEVRGEKESQRRLLYNGITRARNHCTVIIQGQPEEKRIDSIFKVETQNQTNC